MPRAPQSPIVSISTRIPLLEESSCVESINASVGLDKCDSSKYLSISASHLAQEETNRTILDLRLPGVAFYHK